jgi:hypothetical protein
MYLHLWKQQFQRLSRRAGGRQRKTAKSHVIIDGSVPVRQVARDRTPAVTKMSWHQYMLINRHLVADSLPKSNTSLLLMNSTD